jgi:hypothetical protein
MKISDFFTLDEMCRSSTAERAKIDNTPSQEVIDNLKMLCTELLDPIREHAGPVTINSGFRSKALNKAVGGSSTSDHLTGGAADFVIDGDLVELAKWISEQPLCFHQLIIEDYDDKTRTCKWLHISLRASGNKKEILTMRRVKGKVVYSSGLP